MQQQTSRNSKSFDLARLNRQNKLNRISKSFQLRNDNSSDYQEMTLAEFSSLYNFSSLLSDIDSIKKEVQGMKENKNKSLIKDFLNEKMRSASKYLSDAKMKLKDDALSKFHLGKEHSKNISYFFPSIGKEVVKRCSKPQGYLLFRKQKDFIPKSEIKQKKDTEDPDQIVENKSENKGTKKKQLKRAKIKMRRKFLQGVSDSDLSLKLQLSQQEQSQQDQSKVKIKETIVNIVNDQNEIKNSMSLFPSLKQRSISLGKHLTTNRTRHTLTKESEMLLNQVMEEFAIKQPYSNLSYQQQIIQIVKLVAIERNLKEEQMSELLLSATREILEMELSYLSQSRFSDQFIQNSIPEYHFMDRMNSRVQIVSTRLDSLKHFYQNIQALMVLQADLKNESKSIKREQNWINEWFEELENFYKMINEGDMPKHEDAQQLFEVIYLIDFINFTLIQARKLQQIWNYKEEYQMINKFKQISNSNGINNGLLALQRYEHNRFVRESQKRRQEMKQMN